MLGSTPGDSMVMVFPGAWISAKATTFAQTWFNGTAIAGRP
jgi:hypothetical protein